MFLVIGILLLLTVAAGCVVSIVPTESVVDFTTDDPEMEKAILEAAQEWTDQGVVVAARVTVNVNPKGLPIRFLTSEEMIKKCGAVKRGERTVAPDGCAHGNSSGKTDGLYIKQGLEPGRVRITLLHELMHIIGPINGHLPDGVIGIMSKRATSSVITQADLDFVGASTEVV